MSVILTDEQRARAIRLMEKERERAEKAKARRRTRADMICLPLAMGTKERIRALTDETLVDFVNRVVEAELERLQNGDDL